MSLKENDGYEESDFPQSYEIVNEIKSPLNVLWYNLRFEFPDKYPAKMPEDFARDMIKLYSKENDFVYDPMCGSGTVPRIAGQMKRESLGTDINPKAVELALKHDTNGNYFCGDARYFKPVKKPDVILFSPPFGLNIIGDMNQYSNEEHDVSRQETYPQFFIEMEKIFKNQFDILKAGGIMIFDSRDRTKDKTYYDLSVIFRNMCLKAGFEIVARYWYVLIPYRQMTYKHKSGIIMPMVSAMDCYVMYKPLDTKIDSF